MKLLELSDFSKEFREPNGAVRTLFERALLEVRSTDTSIALIGRSGSGKTTLLRVLAGLDLDYSGRYWAFGAELSRTDSTMASFRRQRVGIISQRGDLLGDLTALHNVMLGLGSLSRAHRPAAHAALEQVGLAALARHKVRQMSGGEAQRVAIARAIVKSPVVLLADEPTGALDEKTEDEMLGLFAELQSRGTVLLVATHSARVAVSCGRRLAIEHHQLLEM